MTKTRRILMLFISLVISVASLAQKQEKFDPGRFQRDLEQFIVKEALLTPSEASIFFPVYREMRAKQWAYMCEDRRLRLVDTSDDKACAEAIKRRDDNDLEMKTLQMQYHMRFMTLLPASKVYRILRAEDKFHRQLFKSCSVHGHKKANNAGKKIDAGRKVDKKRK